jgi:hypothetical protein
MISSRNGSHLETVATVVFTPRVAGWSLAVAVLLCFTVGANASEILTNGGFEAGGGSFLGWTHLNQAGSSGDWFIQSGTSSPLTGSPVPLPPGPTHAAMTDQDGPGSRVLYQDFVVPVGVSSATLSFDRFRGNRADVYSTPASLDFTVTPNQQARVDIITTTADPFSVAGADVLLNVFQTHTGDPTVDASYITQTNDLTALLAAHQGQTLRLRFGEVDNQLFFQFGVDNVSLDVTTAAAVPEPSTLALLAIGGGSLFGYGRRCRRRRLA